MNLSPVSFGKKYISKANVLDNSTKKKIQMDFVEYDKSGEDLLHIFLTSKLWSKKYGERNTYIDTIAGDLYDVLKNGIPSPNTRFFGIEDKNGQIQAICETGKISNLFVRGKEKDPTSLIKYISTNPKSMYGKEEREYTKLGLSLFREILQYLKQKDPNDIAIYDKSGGFWERIPNMQQKQINNLNVCYLTKGKQQDTISKLNKLI